MSMSYGNFVWWYPHVFVFGIALLSFFSPQYLKVTRTFKLSTSGGTLFILFMSPPLFLAEHYIFLSPGRTRTGGKGYRKNGVRQVCFCLFSLPSHVLLTSQEHENKKQILKECSFHSPLGLLMLSKRKPGVFQILPAPVFLFLCLLF